MTTNKILTIISDVYTRRYPLNTEINHSPEQIAVMHTLKEIIDLINKETK